jgi:hypothetical protein
VKVNRILTYKNDSDIESPPASSPKMDFNTNRRKRKSASQLDLLASEYVRCPNWSRKKINEMAERTGLSEG